MLVIHICILEILGKKSTLLIIYFTIYLIFTFVIDNLSKYSIIYHDFAVKFKKNVDNINIILSFVNALFEVFLHKLSKI